MIHWQWEEFVVMHESFALTCGTSLYFKDSLRSLDSNSRREEIFRFVCRFIKSISSTEVLSLRGSFALDAVFKNANSARDVPGINHQAVRARVCVSLAHVTSTFMCNLLLPFALPFF
jgi:hypothetical protein